jgi:hypothetical protein
MTPTQNDKLNELLSKHHTQSTQSPSSSTFGSPSSAAAMESPTGSSKPPLPQQQWRGGRSRSNSEIYQERLEEDIDAAMDDVPSGDRVDEELKHHIKTVLHPSKKFYNVDITESFIRDLKSFLQKKYPSMPEIERNAYVDTRIKKIKNSISSKSSASERGRSRSSSGTRRRSVSRGRKSSGDEF